METLEVLVGGVAGIALPGDASHHLSDQDQIDDQRGSKEGVLADVEQADGLVTTHEDFRIVLVQSTLVVTHGGHVLDDDGVIGVFALLVEDGVGLNHVIDDVGLGNFLGTELALGGQVHAIVVAKVVVAGNGGELDTSVDQEIDESRLHLGLARLEVISSNIGALLLGVLDSSGDEGVLGRTVDEGSILEDRGNGKDGRRRDLFVAVLDGLDQVIGSVVNSGDDISVALSVGGPHDNDLVETVLLLEFAVCRS